MSKRHANKAPRRRQRNKAGGWTENPCKRRSYSGMPTNGSYWPWLRRRMSQTVQMSHRSFYSFLSPR